MSQQPPNQLLTMPGFSGGNESAGPALLPWWNTAHGQVTTNQSSVNTSKASTSVTSAESSVASAQGNLEITVANLQAAQHDLGNATLTATHDGIVTTIRGVIGLLVGLLVGWLMTHVLLSALLGSSGNVPLIVTPTILILPFAVSLGVSVVFGLYPAIRPSRLNPIVVIRRAR